MNSINTLKSSKHSKKTSRYSILQRLNRPKNKVVALIIFWVLVTFPFVIFGTLIFLISIGVFGSLPTFEELENPKSNLATEVISSDGENLGFFFVENRSFVEYDELSPYLVKALVATEDIRYYKHSGIDFIGLSRVLFKTIILAQKGQGGGSTISQQLAKNLYPRTIRDSNPIVNTGTLVVAKLKEWITATMLEYNYTKEEIIAMYLNTVAYGSNAFGIKSASNIFFNKHPQDLTVNEAAMLIGVVNAPTRYSPRSNPENALRRRNTVVARMNTAGFITDKQLREFKSKPVELDYTPMSHNLGTATYFREMIRLYLTANEPTKKGLYQSQWDFNVVKKMWQNDPLFGWCSKNKKADGTPYNIYRDGLKIYTTINSKMQRYAEEVMLEHMGNPETGVQAMFDWQRNQNNGKVFYDVTAKQEKELTERLIRQSERARVMRNSGANELEIKKAFETPMRMKIFTYQGDIDTTLTPTDSLLHYKSILKAGFMTMDPSTGYIQTYVGGVDFKHFKFDMIRQGRRQVGSVIKPFVYTFAISQLGYTPCTLVPNLPVTIEIGGGAAPWTPKESTPVFYDGKPRHLRWGLARSRNNYSAWIMKQANPKAVADFINNMGITSYIHPVYSLCLGSSEISVFDMVGAFSTFVNRGVHTTPFFITRIEDKQGNTVASFSPITKDAISEKTAYTMIDMLKYNISAGTGRRLGHTYNMHGDVGGKTGSTNKNADAWFMAVTPKVVGGVWVGGEEMATHIQGGEGSVLALPIFGKFMKKVYNDKSLGIFPHDKFLEPVGLVKYDCNEVSLLETIQTTNEDIFFE